jgi:ABC-2 type transport system ATP-binding protein
MSDGWAIDLHGVEKLYRGKVQALRGIDMRVRRGEVFGLLGPNGAGKSTLVKIMMTIVRATRAQGTLLGRPIGHKPTLAHVGYLPENHRFPRYLTGRQVLELFASLSGVERTTRRKRIGELLATVGMTEPADRKISTYSKGMMQRIGLAQALANDPDLVVLDEPTDGVDPEGRHHIRTVLGQLRDQGKTVFVNSHLLSELELISNRVAILVNGQVARQGTMDELTIAKQRYEIDVVPQSGRERDTIRDALPGVFGDTIAGPLSIGRGKLAGGQWAELVGLTLRLGITEPADVQPILDALRHAGLMIRRLQPVRPSLEDLFMETVAAPPPIPPNMQGGRA